MSRNVVLTVVATAAITTAAVELYHRYCAPLKKSTTKKTLQPPRQRKFSPDEYSEELIREQLARNYAFLTVEGMAKVRNQRIIVVGAGGVGSWVATMLARSGVEHLRIIDFDQVSLSSLNRHAVATISDVGISKVDCLKTHLLQIVPWIEIDVQNKLWNLDLAQELLDFNPTYVIDCIWWSY